MSSWKLAPEHSRDWGHCAKLNFRALMFDCWVPEQLLLATVRWDGADNVFYRCTWHFVRIQKNECVSHGLFLRLSSPWLGSHLVSSFIHLWENTDKPVAAYYTVPILKFQKLKSKFSEVPGVSSEPVEKGALMKVCAVWYYSGRDCAGMQCPCCANMQSFLSYQLHALYASSPGVWDRAGLGEAQQSLVGWTVLVNGARGHRKKTLLALLLVLPQPESFLRYAWISHSKALMTAISTDNAAWDGDIYKRGTAWKGGGWNPRPASPVRSCPSSFRAAV